MPNLAPNLPDHICFYCGESADTRDHVIPLSHVGGSWLRKLGNKRWTDSPWVYACRECNGLLSDRVFDTLDDRLEYLKWKLRLKHAKDLTHPDWSKSEITSLKGWLRSRVAGASARKERTLRRLGWLPYASEAA